MKTKTNDRLGLYRSLVVSLAEVMSQPSDLRLIVETEEFVSGDNNDYRYYMIDTVAGLEKNLGCGRYDGDDCDAWIVCINDGAACVGTRNVGNIVHFVGALIDKRRATKVYAEIY